jgi:hypothetical protein
MMDSGQRRALTWLARAALLVLPLLLVAGALVLRLKGFSWESNHEISEEIRHAQGALNGLKIRDVFRTMYGQAQPALDYLLRKLFWFPLLGVDERSIRMVSLVYGLAAVLAAYWLSFRYLALRLPALVAGFLAFAIGASIAAGPDFLFLSVYGRHYTFVILLSVLWYGAYFLRGAFSRPGFHWLSLIFLNVHFFAAFPIFLIYAAESLYLLRRTQYRDLLRLVGIGLAILIFTVMVNLKAVKVLVFAPPAPVSTMDISGVLANSFLTYLRFWRADIGIPVLLLAAGLASLAWHRRWFLLGQVVLLPLLVFIFLSVKSTYGIEPRYLAVFWGLPLIFLAVAVRDSYESVSRTGLHRGPGLSRAGRGLLAIVLLAFLGGPKVVSAALNFSAYRTPPRNFTEVFHLYDRMKKASNAPILLLYDDCYTGQVPQIYLGFIEPEYRYGHMIEDTKGCGGYSFSQVHARLKHFLDFNPKGEIYFESRLGGCNKDLPVRVAWRGMAAHKFFKGRYTCLWKFENTRDLPGLLGMIKNLGLGAHPGFLTLDQGDLKNRGSR